MAHLKDSVEVDDHYELEIDSKEDAESNQEAADVCPVNIIHVKKMKIKLMTNR